MSLDIDIQGLHTPDRTLMANTQLHVASGTIHTLMGPSGCGKSSLLLGLCGLLRPPMTLQAKVQLNGVAVDDWPTHQKRIGLLFQDDWLFEHMTVWDNLLYAVPRGRSAARQSAVEEALAAIELQDHAHAMPATLSGGQRTRVALMRALLAQPLAVLLDEPFARLDGPLRARVRERVFALLRERGVPALLVTHDAQDIADVSLVTQLDRPFDPPE
jgi:putative thiamine transport system ATP-binding protein